MLADEGVEQRGLAHVGPADQGYEAAAEVGCAFVHMGSIGDEHRTANTDIRNSKLGEATIFALVQMKRRVPWKETRRIE